MKKSLDKVLGTPLGMVGTGIALGTFFLLIFYPLSFFIGYADDGIIEPESLWLGVLLILALVINHFSFLALFLYFGYLFAKRGLGVTDSGFRVATVYVGIALAMIVVNFVVFFIFTTGSASLFIEDSVAQEEFVHESGKAFGEDTCGLVLALLVGTPINFGIGALGAMIAGRQKKKAPASKPKKA